MNVHVSQSETHLPTLSDNDTVRSRALLSQSGHATRVLTEEQGKEVNACQNQTIFKLPRIDAGLPYVYSS